MIWRDFKMIFFYCVVPIYNVEDYIAECLESLLAQEYRHFKAILVNDGSTDNSGKIAESYAKKDTRFVYLSQSNKGVSSARNVALDWIFENEIGDSKILNGGGNKGSKNSKNKLDSADFSLDSATRTFVESALDSAYIAFLDPDDFLEKYALSHIAEILSKNPVDTFVSNQFFSLIGEQKGIFDYKIFKRNLEGRIFSKNELLHKAPDTLITTIAGFVIRAEILQNVRFNENICYGEDVLFCTEATLKSSAIYIDGRAIYNYRIRENSAVRDESRAKIIAKANAMFFIAEYFYEKLQNDKQLRKFYIFNIRQSIKKIIRFLQKYDYSAMDFDRQDLAKFLPYIDLKRKIALKFPRIYNFPKTLKRRI